MNLNLLEVFVAVATHRSFTKAARQLGIQRSAASRRVAALEDELGVQLLIRSTRQVEVTTAGRRLLDDVEPLLSRLHAAVHQLPETSPEPAGELTITSPPDLGYWLLPPVLGALTRQYPALRPVVHLSNRVVDLEREGFDVAIRVSLHGLPDSGLRARKLGVIVANLYAAPCYLQARGHPASLDDLDQHTVVGAPTSSVLGHDPRRVLVDDMVFACELARHGAGIAWLPQFLAAPAVADGSLVRVLPDRSFTPAGVYAVFPSSRELPPKITAFRDALVQRLAEHPLPRPDPPAPT